MAVNKLRQAVQRNNAVFDPVNGSSNDSTRKIFVGGLVSQATEADLTAHFSQWGIVAESLVSLLLLIIIICVTN